MNDTATHTGIQPYLFFSGRCEEALDFYTAAAGATVQMLMRFNESPDAVPEGMLPPGFETKVMHSAFQIAGATVLASDGCSEVAEFKGFSLALTVGSEAEARSIFDNLADGGQVQMPLGPTFWSPCYGQLTDRFGVAWMLMVPPAAAST